MEVLRLAEYIRRLRADSIRLYPENPRPCPSCGSVQPQGIFVSVRQQVVCDRCLPPTRRCARCHDLKGLVEFDVTGSRVSCYCHECRRIINREHYSSVQAAKPHEVPRQKQCQSCHRLLGREEFFEDHRYADGLMNRCFRCHNRGRRLESAVLSLETWRQYTQQWTRRRDRGIARDTPLHKA